VIYGGKGIKGSANVRFEQQGRAMPGFNRGQVIRVLELDSTVLLNSIERYGYIYCITNNLLSKQLVVKMLMNKVEELRLKILGLKSQLFEMLLESVNDLEESLFEDAED
jgi:hypothetical protein